MGPYCCCDGCNEKYAKGRPYTFHNFPKDEQRAKLWLQKINRGDFVPTSYSKVCSKHFTKDCFYRHKNGAIWLKNNAVPTVFDFPKMQKKDKGGRKRPAKRKTRVPKYGVKASSQDHTELLESIQRKFVPILPAPDTTANRVWCILVPVVPKPGEMRPGSGGAGDAATAGGEANDGESDRMPVCHTVNLKEAFADTFVKQELVGDEDKSVCSPPKGDYENSLVEEESREDCDTSAFSTTKEKMVYKYCVVPHCKNTSIKTPDKLFVQVPKDEKRRKKWLKLARKDPKQIAPTSCVYFCEDHFDLERDIENYNQYRLGFSKRLLLAKSALPSKFYCQQDRRKRTGGCRLSRSAYIKRQKRSLIRECEEAVRSNETAIIKESETQNAKELESIESSNEVTLEHSASLIIWECGNVIVKQEPADDVTAAAEECEYVIVKEEPIEELDESVCSAAEEVSDRITVKLEQYEENSYERHREQESEYVEVKDEPLEAEDPSDLEATHWVSPHFW